MLKVSGVSGRRSLSDGLPQSPRPPALAAALRPFSVPTRAPTPSSSKVFQTPRPLPSPASTLYPRLVQSGCPEWAWDPWRPRSGFAKQGAHGRLRDAAKLTGGLAAPTHAPMRLSTDTYLLSTCRRARGARSGEAEEGGGQVTQPHGPVSRRALSSADRLG